MVLEGGRLVLIPLREDEPMLVRIPPGVPHGAVNSSRHYATVVNAVLRHGPPDPRDYKPRPMPAMLMEQWQAVTGDRPQTAS